MSTDPTCLFCRIVAGEIPARVVYEDDTALAFLDIAPWQVGHTLVIPKRHVLDVVSDDTVLAELGPVIAKVARLLQERLGADACNVVSNAGAVAGQEVFHAHVHVLPRYAATPGIANLRTRVDEDAETTLARLNYET